MLMLNINIAQASPDGIFISDKPPIKLAEYFDKRECVKQCNGANEKCYQNQNPLDWCKKTYKHCLNMCDEGVYTYRKGYY